VKTLARKLNLLDINSKKMKNLFLGSILILAMVSCSSNADKADGGTKTPESTNEVPTGTSGAGALDTAHPTNQTGQTGNGGVGTGASSATGAGTDESGSGNGTPSGGRP